MPKKVIMPALGMAQESGLLLAWLKDEGDIVQQGDPLMEIETDKVTVEIEANASGKLVNVMAQVGEDVPVGEVIAYIMYDSETLADIPQAQQAPADKPTSAPKTEIEASVSISPVAARMLKEHDLAQNDIQTTNGRINKSDVVAYINQQGASTLIKLQPASPKARRLAKEQNYNLQDIKGTGPTGAIITEDILAYTPLEETSQILETLIPTAEQIVTSRSWQVMASRLTTSWQTIPHFYLRRTVNVDKMIAWRESLKTNNLSVTYTDLLVKIVAMALAQHPQLNARMVDNTLYNNPTINVGLAVAVDDGLLVPVIPKANTLGVSAISEQRATLIQKAQSATLQPADLQNGTFTISNLGMLAIDEFSAIVNPPQVAILAVGAMQSKLEMIDDEIKQSTVMTFCLSCDHRAVDGARGAYFLKTLANYIEEPHLMLS